jgi:hypothetical protein
MALKLQIIIHIIFFMFTEIECTFPVIYVLYHVGGLFVKWVPCHHGMARPQVADGGDGLLVTMAWRVLRLRMEETASRYGG